MDSNISITQFRNHTAGRVFGSNGSTGAPEQLTFSGLHVTAAALALGGTLTENVAIVGATGSFSVSMTELGGFTVGTSSAAITASSTVAISSTSTFGITSGSSLTASATTTMSFTAGGDASFGTSSGTLTLSATTDLNFVFGTIKLNGTAASTPTTQFLRGDGTWGIPAGGGGGISDGDKGDITVSGSGTVWTIDNDVVTYAKMQNVSATARIMGRITSGAGDMEELTGTQATTLLNTFTNSLKGLVPASGGGSANFLRADGNWAAPIGTPGGSNTEIQINSSGVFAGGKLFVPSSGNLDMGDTGLSGAARQIIVKGSASNITAEIHGKGTGGVKIVPDTAASSTNFLTISKPTVGGGTSGMLWSTDVDPSGGTVSVFDYRGTAAQDIFTLQFQNDKISLSAGTLITGSSSKPFVISGSIAVAASKPASELVLHGGDSGISSLVGADLTLRGGDNSASGGTAGDVNISPGVKTGGGGGSNGNLIITNIPTSSAGLPSGAIWNNAGVLCIA